MSQYWSKQVHGLTPYVPGEQPKNQTDLVKLNTNENPYPPSPQAVQAMQEVLEKTGENLRLYPDPNADELKQTIADYYSSDENQLDKNNIFVGNGSDEVLAHIFYGLFQHDKPILFPDITYSFYPVYCGLYEKTYQQIPLNEKFEIDVSGYNISNYKENGGIIFPNPNAPTGVLTPLSETEALLQQNTESVVVIDEAYIDFASSEESNFGKQSAVSLVKKYPQLLVVQTLSKSRSLAGLRVGFAIGHSDLIEGLERVKNSFNSYPLGRLSLAGASASFKDERYFQQTCQKIINDRDGLCSELENLGFTVLPSAANFVFVSHAKYEGKKLAEELREKNVIVRHFNQGRIDNYLRITIGTTEQNLSLVSVLKNILS